MPRKPRKRITSERQVERITVAKERRDFAIADAPALILRVSTTGSKSWLYRPEKGKAETFAVYPGSPNPRQRAVMTLDHAKKHVQARLAERINETEIEQQIEHHERELRRLRRLQGHGLTVLELCQRFLEHKRGRVKHLYFLEQPLRCHVVPVFGEKLAVDVTTADVLAITDGIADDFPAMAIKVHETLGQMFKWAKVRRLVLQNPTEGLESPVTAKPRSRVLSDDEIAALWDQLERIRRGEGRDFPAVWVDLVQDMLACGQRGAEHRAFEWRHLDSTGRWWSILQNKKDRPHQVYRGELAAFVLERRRQADVVDHRLVFSERHPLRSDTCMPTRTFRRRVQHVSRDLVAEGLLPGGAIRGHDLRRTMATRMVDELGVDVIVVRRILNHVLVRGATGRYVVPGLKNQAEEAMVEWNRHLLDLVAETTPALRATRTV